tara:strand:+ start:526 stop:981 length:456 start_codon:yes stop_codon:yes gene_type:complete
MKYYQRTILSNLNLNFVINAFQDIRFVKYLTRFLPIRIVIWEGIKTGDVAYFKLWFFGWKDFKVEHDLVDLNSDFLCFIDRGICLPFGLKFWEHKHIIRKLNNSIEIVDTMEIVHDNSFQGKFLYPVLIFPVMIRKILYRSYFNSIKNKNE